MPTLAITRNYLANTVLTQAQLDAQNDSIETFVNTTKLDDDNIQANSLTAASLAPNAVGSSEIANDAVIADKILNGVVSKAKLDVTTTTAPDELSNFTLAVSVGSNALTVAVKTLSGTDPSVSDPVTVSFQNGTGGYARRQITAALSLVIPSTATLGTRDAKEDQIWAYLIDNAGTVDLCVSTAKLSEGATQTSIAISTGADSKLLYANGNISTKYVRMIGRMSTTQTTAGTWASAPTNIIVGKWAAVSGTVVQSSVDVTAGNGHGSTDTKIRRISNLNTDVGSDIIRATSAGNGDTFTIATPGFYAIYYNDNRTDAGNHDVGISVNSNQLTTNIQSITNAHRRAYAVGIDTNAVISVGITIPLVKDDVVRMHTDGTPQATADADTHFTITKLKELYE